jgi:hypothetical protein
LQQVLGSGGSSGLKCGLDLGQATTDLDNGTGIGIQDVARQHNAALHIVFGA